MIRSCTGPNGEPGQQAEVDGQVSECFTYDPADPLSKIRAARAVMDAHDQMTAGTDAVLPS